MDEEKCPRTVKIDVPLFRKCIADTKLTLNGLSIKSGVHYQTISTWCKTGTAYLKVLEKFTQAIFNEDASMFILDETPTCLVNEHVTCFLPNCRTCGFSKPVETKRKECLKWKNE